MVLWRLRYKLSLRDLPEMFAVPGIVFSHEAVREWEAKLTPALAEDLRQRRRGKVGHSGSVSTCTSKYSLCPRTCSDAPLCGFQDGQHHHTPPEVEQSASVGGHVLVMTGARAEKVADLVVSATEPSG